MIRQMVPGVVLAAALSLLPASSYGQDAGNGADSPCGECGMHEMMQENGQGMMGAMGPGGCGMGMMGGGMMGGPGMGGEMMRGGRAGGGMMGWRAFGMLNLTPDQRTKLNRIRYDLRKQIWSLQGKLIDNDAALRDLYQQEPLDPKKIGSVYGSIFDVKRQMIEAKITALNRARGILTQEQLSTLKQLQQYGGGFGGMHREMMQDWMSSAGTKTDR